MANKFQLVISAVDKATAVVRRIKQQFASITQATQSATKQLGRMRKSVSGWSKGVGLNQLPPRLVAVGSAAADTAGKLRSMLAPMLAFIGIGSVSAIIAMSLGWGRLGAEIERTAEGLAMSTVKLQTLDGAARMAGVSSGALSSNMRTLGDTINDAMVGRNVGAFGLLQRLGIDVKRTKEGAIDTTTALYSIARAMNSPGLKGKVQTQDYIASQLGVTELLPFLRQGEKGIRDYEAMVAQFAMSDADTRKAQEFQRSMTLMEMSVGKLRNVIGGSLAPVLQPLIHDLTEWIGRNQALIGQNVSDFARDLAAWLRQIDFKQVGHDAMDFIRDIRALVQMLGGWRNALIALVVVMNGPLIASMAKLSWQVGRLGVTALPVLVRVLAGLPSSLAGVMVNLGSLTETVAGAVRGIPLLSGVLTTVSEGFVAAGIAIEATPVGWILTAIAAVAFGAYAIYRNWDNIVQYFEDKWTGIRESFQQNWLLGIVKVLDAFNPVSLISDAMNGLVKWLTGIDLYDVGRQIIGSLARGMQSITRYLPMQLQQSLGLDGVNAVLQAAAQPRPGQPAKAAAKGAAVAPAIVVPNVGAAGALPGAAANIAQALKLSGAAPGNMPALPTTALSAMSDSALQPTLDTLAKGMASVAGNVQRLLEVTIRAAAALTAMANGTPYSSDTRLVASPLAAVPTANAVNGRAPLGIRQNNPGNLRHWIGAAASHGFAAFDTPMQGLSAMAANLRSYGRQGFDTIEKIVNRWAPASDHNNVGAYVADMSRSMGAAPNAPLNLSDANTLASAMRAIIRHENGVQPYSDDMINQAASGSGGRSSSAGNSQQRVHVSVAFQNTPAGTRVRTQSEGDNTSHSVRVGYAMPSVA